MAVIYVFNPERGIVERYYRGLLDPMPYVIGRTLTVGEFRGYSQSNILWTDKRAMDSWNAFRQGWGAPIFVGYAFKRIWEGGHSPQSQHYAGLAFDIAQNLTAVQRAVLYQYAVNSGVWSYVDPPALTPRWIHVDRRFGVPACPAGGFPALRLGSLGVYVFLLQDALNALGFTGGGLDGSFGPGTRRAVINFQTQQGLSPDGIVGCLTWARVTSLANGIGMTGTVSLG